MGRKKKAKPTNEESIYVEPTDYEDEMEMDSVESDDEELDFDKYDKKSSYDDMEESDEEDDELDESEEKELKKIEAENEGVMYVDPVTFLSDIRDYYETDVFSQRLADSIFLIAKKMASRGNFCSYSWKDEMILDGYEKMAMAIYKKKYDASKKSNPFSYLSRICWRCFVLRIKMENRHKDEERKYREHTYDRIKAENTGIRIVDNGIDSEGQPIMATEVSEEDDEWN